MTCVMESGKTQMTGWVGTAQRPQDGELKTTDPPPVPSRSWNDVYQEGRESFPKPTAPHWVLRRQATHRQRVEAS